MCVGTKHDQLSCPLRVQDKHLNMVPSSQISLLWSLPPASFSRVSPVQTEALGCIRYSAKTFIRHSNGPLHGCKRLPAQISTSRHIHSSPFADGSAWSSLHPADLLLSCGPLRACSPPAACHQSQPAGWQMAWMASAQAANASSTATSMSDTLSPATQCPRPKCKKTSRKPRTVRTLCRLFLLTLLSLTCKPGSAGAASAALSVGAAHSS